MMRREAQGGTIAPAGNTSTHNVFIWWRHFGFTSEPMLSINGAHLKDEEKIFVGRSEEIDHLREWAESQDSNVVLLAGPAGSGKTSLVHHAFSEYPEFVRIDFARGMKPESFPYLLAMQLVDACSQLPNLSTDDVSRIKDIQTSLMNDTGVTTTIAAGASAKLLGAGIEATGSQATETRPIKIPDSEVAACRHLVDILYRSYHQHLILSLDEADSELVPGITPGYVMGLIRALQMPDHSMTIWPTRDRQTRDNFSRLNSVEKQVFSERISLSGLGAHGGPRAVEILQSRFIQAGLSWSDSPISSEVAEFIGRLSQGNIREFIRYTKTVLEESARTSKKAPIGMDYAGEVLVRFYEELRLSPEERIILEFLRDRPSSSSDKEFCDLLGVGRTQVLEKMKPLVDQERVSAVEGKQTKITYKVTPSTLALLKLPVHDE
ncbi:MAG: AAA family ATPase [Armatimonadota bacterium]